MWQTRMHTRPHAHYILQFVRNAVLLTLQRLCNRAVDFKKTMDIALHIALKYGSEQDVSLSFFFFFL